jgi:hypothetical protein
LEKMCLKAKIQFKDYADIDISREITRWEEKP